VKIAATIARYLLGLIFLVFGANKLYTFMPQGPLPGGAAGEFLGALVSTRYLMFIGLLEAVGGALLLVNRYVPIALTLLAPIIVNILLVGILMSRQGLPAGIVVTILWFLVYFRVRSAFAGLFLQRVAD
jgi:hypothetical protein